MMPYNHSKYPTQDDNPTILYLFLYFLFINKLLRYLFNFTAILGMKDNETSIELANIKMS